MVYMYMDNRMENMYIKMDMSNMDMNNNSMDIYVDVYI